VWVDEDTLDAAAVAVAERIIKAGLQQLPIQPYLVIWRSSFMIDVQGSYQSGYAELQVCAWWRCMRVSWGHRKPCHGWGDTSQNCVQNAKKMPNPSFMERFCIFARDQEHPQKASAATSGDNANIDLVSYVEFQRNYRYV
jgi:hypothetical protein